MLREVRKRQIREVGARFGLPFVEIIRIRNGTMRLSSLKPREWRYLSGAEVAALKGPMVLKGEPGKANPKS